MHNKASAEHRHYHHALGWEPHSTTRIFTVACIVYAPKNMFPTGTYLANTTSRRSSYQTNHDTLESQNRLDARNMQLWFPWLLGLQPWFVMNQCRQLLCQVILSFPSRLSWKDKSITAGHDGSEIQHHEIIRPRQYEAATRSAPCMIMLCTSEQVPS